MFQANIDYRLPHRLRGTMLQDIMDARLQELVGAIRRWPAPAIKQALERAPEVRSFRKSLLRQTPAFIAEVKRASPSAGLLREALDPAAIATEFEQAGAAAISVVTEGNFFRGSLEDLARIRWRSETPLLCKDFIVDSYQVLAARHAGADAVLLIAGVLDPAKLKSLRLEAEEYGMEALVEVHDEGDLEATLESGASLVGVNNRDLRSFGVSLETSLRLAPRLPPHVVAISESGIRASEDVRQLASAGYRGVLVGESLMRAASPGAELRKLMVSAGTAPRKAT